MAKNFAQRLDKLERLAEELLSRTVAHRILPFDPDYTAEDYERIRHEMLDEMVAAGEIVEGQQERVRFTRWMTKDEDAAMGCKLAEALKWSAVSEEAAAVEPMPVELSVEDRLADAEMRRKFARPLDEIVPLPEGIV
jgi:hypothetical protein